MRPLFRSRSIASLAVALLALSTIPAFTTPAESQIRLRDAASRLGDRAPNMARVLEGDPPITTSLQHATFAVDSLDNFRPDDLTPFRARGLMIGAVAVDSLDNVPLRAISDLDRTSNGGFVLRPGYWEMHTQSYCLKAGTHGPGGGDGYLYAPPNGPAEEAVISILHNSVDHPEIQQTRIQQLLWAIIARAKFEDLNSELKAVASALLSPHELATLNRSAIDMLPGPALDRALASLPGPIRRVLEAEAQLRRMLTSAESSFEEMERVAVLAGAAPMGEGSQNVPLGRWSRHPDGYYVRYLPRGYSYTVVEVWVQEGSTAAGKEFDPATHIAVPGNTARQRLILSGRMRDAT